jgi:hypothetical protein
MKILYLGDDDPNLTSAHRAKALQRLGHDVRVINPRSALPPSRLVGGISTRMGYGPFVPWVNVMLRIKIDREAFDLAWVDCGAELSPGFHHWMRARGIKIVNYNLDDPFGVRDGHKWDLYRQSVRLHDLTVVVRSENVAEAKAAGARNIMHVFRSYDPEAHAPVALTEKEQRDWASEVAFVGSWMPERGPFMVRLLELGVPLAIWGNDWRKAPEYERLRPIIRGPAVYGRDYVSTIQSAKIALGLLSKGNRDLHTTRSAEVPFIGGAVFCAERTVEHEAMYADGVQALFWSSAEECAARCLKALSEPARLKQIAENGRRRVLDLRLTNDDIARAALAKLVGLTEAPCTPIIQVN